MTLTFLLLVLLRAAVAIVVVVGASALAEAAGPFWGGLIVSLPISAGPAYVMLGLQHDAAFIAAGALASLAANAVSLLYMFIIIVLAPRLRWPLVLAIGLAVWFAVAWVVRQVHWDLTGVLLLNLAMLGSLLWLSRSARRIDTVRAKPTPRRWFELPMRALMVGTLTASVVTASQWLGPSLTGMAAVFPIATTGLALVTLPRLGGRATAALFASTLVAMPGFAIAVLVLHLTAQPFGVWWGMVTALGAQLVFAALLLLGHRVPAPRAAAEPEVSA
ncbi:MAG TPA: hypothetical protein VFN42_11375 [Acetobacteraceae bacterium]|nr:hypothetical protein [Acetobacteraceae bacterium]